MTTLISRATGNFTTSTTWSLCSANGELDSEAGSTTLDTTNQDSSTFVLEANQIDAVALKLASYAGSPTGTISVTLRNSTAATNVSTVTVNASDLSGAIGWHVFKFGSTHTPNGTDSYLIRVASSVAGNAFYTNGTAKNWTRQVRRTSTQSPASGNKLIIAGEWTAAATSSSFTVTMNNTATTSFGVTAATSPQSITINKNSTMTWGTSSSTNYYLKWKGLFGVFGGGTINIGNIGSPIDSTSTAVLEMDSLSNGESGFVSYAGSTVNIYGAEKTQLGFLMTGLNPGSTSLGMNGNVTGWKSGDEVAMAPTNNQRMESEKRTINTVSDPANSFTITASTVSTRSYSAPNLMAEVINLTRNIKFRGLSSSTQGYVFFMTSSIVNIEYAEFTLLGTNTSTKRGVESTTSSSGTLSMSYCSFHDSNYGFVWNSSDGDVVILNNVFYNTTLSAIYVVSPTSGTSYLISGNTIILTGEYGILSNDCGGEYADNKLVGAMNDGISLAESGYVGGLVLDGTVCHANKYSGISINCSGGEITESSISDLVLWRQELSYGMVINTPCIDMTLSDCVMFGNNSYGMSFSRAVGLVIDTASITDDATYPDVGGIYFGNGCEVEIENSSIFGTITPSAESVNHIIIRNSDYSLSDAADFDTVGLMSYRNEYGMVAIGNYDLDTDLYRTTKGQCYTRSDYSIYLSDPPSMRIYLHQAVPSPRVVTSIGSKGGFFVPVGNGNARTVSVSIRKSVSGDGQAYNGDQPRLMLRKNTAIGVSSDTVIATATNSANGAFETISGTTPTATDNGVFEFYIDCNNASQTVLPKFINIDNFTVIS